MPRHAMLTLVVGGIRSGKSSFAERLVLSQEGEHFYLATAEVHDPEMASRVHLHQERRKSQGWSQTFEQNNDLPQFFAQAPEHSHWLIDCLSLWLAKNCFPEEGLGKDAEWLQQQCNSLIKVFQQRSLHVVMVSNECGLGMVPMDPMARRWADLQGLLNQTMASLVNQVYLVSCGIPISIHSKETL